MKTHRSTHLIVIFLAGLFAAACGTPLSGTSLISSTTDGVAINGYDTVAYHTIEAASKGSPQYEYVWKGAKWFFLNAENRDRFAAAPESYAPEYGGFCAWSLSENTTMNADPEVWKLIDGKLYLIQSEAVKEVWEKGQVDFIEKSNKNWQTINKDKPTPAHGK